MGVVKEWGERQLLINHVASRNSYDALEPTRRCRFFAANRTELNPARDALID